MVCCENCFSHLGVTGFVKENGEVGHCDFCGSDNLKCIDPVDLADFFKPVLSLYREIERGTDYQSCDDPLDRGVILTTLIEDDWGEVVSLDALGDKGKNDLWETIINFITHDKDWYGPNFNSLCTQKYLPEDMWEDLADYIKTERRFTLGRDEESRRDTIDLIEMILPQREDVIPAGVIFYRARLHKVEADRPFNEEEIGPPPPEVSTPGRANPAGIPYFYLASDRDTAIAEVRGWVGAHVTVAKFKTENRIRLIDLSEPVTFDSPFGLDETELLSNLVDTAILNNLGEALAKPVSPHDNLIEYIPSQFLAELIKAQGFDGIKYQSAMATGCNIVLFSHSKTAFLASILMRITEISVKADLGSSHFQFLPSTTRNS